MGYVNHIRIKRGFELVIFLCEGAIESIDCNSFQTIRNHMTVRELDSKGTYLALQSSEFIERLLSSFTTIVTES